MDEGASVAGKICRFPAADEIGFWAGMMFFIDCLLLINALSIYACGLI